MEASILSLLVDLVVLCHLTFVVFVVLGGLLLLRWPRLAWLHLPAAGWGAWVEISGSVCPLTLLEIWLRQLTGASTYQSDFTHRYLLPLLYPVGLTRQHQIILGLLALALNLGIYTYLGRRLIKRLLFQRLAPRVPICGQRLPAHPGKRLV